MRHYGVKTLLLLAFLCFYSQSHAQTAAGIPLDKQVDLGLPQKSDPLTPKKPVVKPPQKKPDEKVSEKKTSYDGLWLVTRISDDCKSRIGDFKIRITDNEISTVIGMSIKGRMLSGGKFEMNAKSPYWIIKFNGKLDKKSGFGKWEKIDTKNNSCRGSIGLTQLSE
ncbi:MAG: hypothetical protein ACRBBN_16485 [Methyloligellaceae bacterium]